MARVGTDRGRAGRPRRRPVRLVRGLVAAAGALSTVVAAGGVSSAATTSLVSSPAPLVNPFIGTAGAVDTFPGPDMPFGMAQWGPDTSPNRTDGSGYDYNDTSLSGFSMDRISGPGCEALGDVPILPTVGAIPASPSAATVGFTHAGETAKIGLYGATLSNGVGVKLTDATHSGIGTFDFPASTQANLLLKVSDSADTVADTSATVVGDDEVTGSVSAGRFCGAPTSYENNYTLHFDITFDHPFTTSGTWGGTAGAVTPGSRSLAQHASRLSKARRTALGAAARAAATPATGDPRPFAGGAPDFTPRAHPSPTGAAGTAAPDSAVADPGGVYLTFDTMKKQTVTAKVGISFTSDANAKLNVRKEIPGWDFAGVQRANVAAWNAMLGRVQIGGGSAAQQTQFYTALYHALLHPNVFSDVNGQYMGFDNKVHTAAKGHEQYANYSGWDIYRSQVQLAALVAPRQTSDIVTSMLNDYAQSGELPRWSLANGESYVMPGDPADPVIADAYAFGARDFDQATALHDMIAQATSDNNVRSGTTQLDQYGYLPSDGKYGAWFDYGSVSTQLEFDSADSSIASLAKSLGDTADYTKFATRAQDWENVFDVSSGYMQPRLSSGQWAPGFSPSSETQFTEGTSAQYTAMVPFNLRALIDARGGDAAYGTYLDGLLANLTAPTGLEANLANEPSLDIPWEYDYIGQPYKTQQAVREAQQQLYFDAPVGQDGNDDLGAMSSWYVWSELGMYPETPGASTLVFGSPVFPKTAIHLANGRTLTIDAPNAQPGDPYVRSLQLNGAEQQRDWTDVATLDKGGTWKFDLSATPNTTWGSDVNDAPPSDATGEQPALTSTTPASGPLVVAPGGTATAGYRVTNVTGSPLTVAWQATGANGVTASPSAGTLTVPAGASATASATVSGGAADAQGSLTFSGTRSGGATVPATTIAVDVAAPNELWPYDGNVGISADSASSVGNFDGSGNSYSEQALTAAGAGVGATVTAASTAYTMPTAAAGQPDNVVVAGQSIAVRLPAGDTSLGLLASADHVNAAAGAAGTLTIHYADGSSGQAPIAVSDWTLGAGKYPLLPNESIAVTTPYRNHLATNEKVTTYLFSISVPLAAGETASDVTGVTLPASPSGDIHVFAVG